MESLTVRIVDSLLYKRGRGRVILLISEYRTSRLYAGESLRSISVSQGETWWNRFTLGFPGRPLREPCSVGEGEESSPAGGFPEGPGGSRGRSPIAPSSGSMAAGRGILWQEAWWGFWTPASLALQAFGPGQPLWGLSVSHSDIPFWSAGRSPSPRGPRREQFVQGW